MRHLNLSDVSAHVIAVLESHHVGQANAVKRDVLLEVIRVRTMDDLLTDRQLRKAVARCSPKVCSGAGGYYVPANKREKQAAIMYHIKKIRGERRRVDAIARAYPELESFVQLKLGEGVEGRL